MESALRGSVRHSHGHKGKGAASVTSLFISEVWCHSIYRQAGTSSHNLLYPQHTSMNLFITLFLFSILKLSTSAGVGERTQIPSKIITPGHAQSWPSHVDSIGQSPFPSATPRPPKILPNLSLQYWVLQSFYSTLDKKGSSLNDRLLLNQMVSVLETVDSEMWVRP